MAQPIDDVREARACASTGRVGSAVKRKKPR